MFNYELRDRVERLCQELSDPSQGEHEPMLSLFFRGACSFNKTIHYEPNETHVRNETYGAHEGARAMVAGKTRRASQLSRRSERNALCILRGSQALAVDMGDGKVQLYDTGDHRISGVQQYQSGSGREVTFTSQHGEGDLATLKPV